jgi:hypothetical protein
MRSTQQSCLALAVGALMLASGAAFAQTLVEQSAEHRFQLDFHVNDAALQKMLPQGWVADVASAGAAKDANIRLIFIDRIDIVGPDGKPKGKGSARMVYLAAPVKQSSGDGKGQMIVAGLVDDAADAPGPFGVYQAATMARMSRTASSTGGPAINEEDYEFTGPGGEHLQVHVKFERGPGTKGGGETKFFNPSDPSKYQIFKTEQAIDIAKNVTVPVPDHVKEFTYKAGGGKLAALFDGGEKVLSWDSFPWYVRTVSTP